MKLEDQVCSLEQAKKLWELGLRADSFWVYDEDFIGSTSHLRINVDFYDLEKCPPAYTVAELGILIGKRFAVVCKKSGWAILDREQPGIVVYRIPGYTQDKPEAQARAAALIWLIKVAKISAKELKL